MSAAELTDGRKTVRLPNGSLLPILDGVSIVVARGQTTAVLGKSGSGKTTLLNVLGLLDPLTSGRLTVDGQDISTTRTVSVARLRGRFFGFIYQRFCLFDHLTARENVALPLVHLGLGTWRTRGRRVTEALERVGLGDRLAHRPAQLSGGEQQRVAIARALVHEPALILADEPIGSLDQEAGAKIIDLLFSLVRENKAGLVIVTHDPDVASRCQQIVRLDRGSLVAA